MLRTFTGRIINVSFALALLLGGMTALMGGQSAAARDPHIAHPGSGGHGFDSGFQSRSFELQPNVVFVPGHWSRTNSGYVFHYEVINRGNLTANNVSIGVVTFDTDGRLARDYHIPLGHLGPGERQRQFVWLPWHEERARVIVGHTGSSGAADVLWLTAPKVRDHRT